ncbi:MAG: cell division protein ZapA [Oscillospiraceae bacterium]|nr:cell division protein ZapA [Oscillospiraceae bacterium]
MLNEVKVIICGKEYKLKTAETPNYIYALARSLESKINAMIESGAGISPYSASIMVSLSLMDDINKANEHLDGIRNEAKAYVDEAGKARIDLEAANKEIEVLKSKIIQLENIVKLKELKDSIDG